MFIECWSTQIVHIFSFYQFYIKMKKSPLLKLSYRVHVLRTNDVYEVFYKDFVFDLVSVKTYW